MIAAVLTLAVSTVLTWLWLSSLEKLIEERLESKKFSSTVELFAAPGRLVRGQSITLLQVMTDLKRLGYTERKGIQTLQSKEFQVPPSDVCLEDLPDGSEAEFVSSCIDIAGPTVDESQAPLSIYRVYFSQASQSVISIEDRQSRTEEPFFELEPEPFAQFAQGRPILKTYRELGETPPLCLNAILAIEDKEFLEHKGFNITSIARAFFKNLKAGRVTQGGSTITQQLVKNYFLTPEKSYTRKAKEFAIAILLETRESKDEILESYINEIYMGQNGAFEVRGFGAASEFYFNKDLSRIDLAECALLAAIINSPGRFNPFKHPEDATERRNRVLDLMKELGMIREDEWKLAVEKTLPQERVALLKEPAPYYVQAVMGWLEERELISEGGIQVFTSMNIQAQQAAQEAVARGISQLEKRKTISKLKEGGKTLEASFVASDPITGDIIALVGGRDYRKSQFNRAIQAKRQVGSVMKPIVYLAALEQLDSQGNVYTPITLISDEKFTLKTGPNTWSPKNYDGKAHGLIPLFYALKESLNIATARLGNEVGLDNILSLARDLGVTSQLQALPSLTLGAFEMTPLEVLQAYSTLARQGKKAELSLVRKVVSDEGHIIYRSPLNREQVSIPQKVAVIIAMLKQVINSGTGQVVKLLGFSMPAAGKTGTTSDYKDTWFAGFTPFVTAVSWVGYDDNTPTGLSGASGAAPIWADFMKQFAARYPPNDFKWPEGTELRELSVEDQLSLGIVPGENEILNPVELLFETNPY